MFSHIQAVTKYSFWKNKKSFMEAKRKMIQHKEVKKEDTV